MRPCNTEITREFDIDIPLRIHISYDKIKLIILTGKVSSRLQDISRELPV